MIIINQLKCEIEFKSKSTKKLYTKDVIDSREVLVKKAARQLRIAENEIQKVQILKHSIDARKKTQIFNVYLLGVSLKNNRLEEKVVKKCKNNNISLNNICEYKFPVSESGKEKNNNDERPIIVGMGPAGLFCAYMLAKYGYRPIVLERGNDVDTRSEDVERYWKDGVLNPESNVQFGEGGAGTFSDGKLNTLVKDKNGRNKEVLRIFVECGAPEEILYEAKPHIGTDILKKVVVNMREKIIENGGTVRFGAKMTSLLMENNKIYGVVINETEEIKSPQVVLAIGHSARDTFKYLEEIQISMEAKSFAVGMRVEHPQELINESMYGAEYGRLLPAAPYKLTAKTSQNRGVYSFCMCPGGYVVNASSEKNRIAVNGMSYSDRGSHNANSAIIVQVTPQDYNADGPLSGVEFQRRLEERAYTAGSGKIPVQYFGDYINNKTSEEREDYNKPCIKGEYQYSNLRGLLPEECEKAFIEGMNQFDKTINGFAGKDAILSGVESRTSSPVRIHREENMQSPSLKGLYPCGEGAGYAGGITSAAMDGILIAEYVAMDINRNDY